MVADAHSLSTVGGDNYRGGSHTRGCELRYGKRTVRGRTAENTRALRFVQPSGHVGAEHTDGCHRGECAQADRAGAQGGCKPLGGKVILHNGRIVARVRRVGYQFRPTACSRTHDERRNCEIIDTTGTRVTETACVLDYLELDRSSRLTPAVRVPDSQMQVPRMRPNSRACGRFRRTRGHKPDTWW
eukprot:6814820-Prymnesium_polylepis.1